MRVILSLSLHQIILWFLVYHMLFSWSLCPHDRDKIFCLCVFSARTTTRYICFM